MPQELPKTATFPLSFSVDFNRKRPGGENGFQGMTARRRAVQLVQHALALRRVHRFLGFHVRILNAKIANAANSAIADRHLPFGVRGHDRAFPGRDMSRPQSGAMPPHSKSSR